MGRQGGLEECPAKIKLWLGRQVPCHPAVSTDTSTGNKRSALRANAAVAGNETGPDIRWGSCLIPGGADLSSFCFPRAHCGDRGSGVAAGHGLCCCVETLARRKRNKSGRSEETRGQQEKKKRDQPRRAEGTILEIDDRRPASSKLFPSLVFSLCEAACGAMLCRELKTLCGY
ncbi:hypothetical protein MRX96_032194 [Rhipicephalus microplus]